MSTFRKIDQVLNELWSCFTCSSNIGATKEQILECQKAIHKFWNSTVLQKHSYTSGQGTHLPPLFFSNMEVTPSVSATINGIFQGLENCGGKVSVDNLGELKREVRDLECQTYVQVRMLNPVIRSMPCTMFVTQLLQDGLVTHNLHLQKVKLTNNSSALGVPFNVEGQFSMDIANEINGQLQAHYSDGILVAYMVDDEVRLTLITAKELCIGEQATEVTQQGMINGLKKRKKY